MGARSIGVAVIMVATMIAGFFVLQAMDDQVPPIMPMTMFFLFTWVVSHSFLNIFGLAVDSMLQCFLTAEELNMPDSKIPQNLRDLRSEHFEAKSRTTSE